MLGYTLALFTKMFSNHRTKIIDFVNKLIFAVYLSILYLLYSYVYTSCFCCFVHEHT